MKINIFSAQSFLNHLNGLMKLAGLSNDNYEATKIYMRLCQLEKQANRIMCDQCNGQTEAQEIAGNKKLARIEAEVKKLLPFAKTVFLNGDPRGYTLKIQESECNEIREANCFIMQDWGSYGCLAYEFK
jgi:hypothetical protein